MEFGALYADIDNGIDLYLMLIAFLLQRVLNIELINNLVY